MSQGDLITHKHNSKSKSKEKIYRCTKLSKNGPRSDKSTKKGRRKKRGKKKKKKRDRRDGVKVYLTQNANGHKR